MRMQRIGARLGALAAALVLAAGCGSGRLILRVDLLSFLDPGEVQAAYGPVPGGVVDSLTVTSDRTVNLVPGLEDVTTVENVDLEAVGEFRNQTGNGQATVRIYLSDPDTDPFTTPPIVAQATLAPATTDTALVSLSGDPRIAALFTGKELRLGIRVILSAAPGIDPVQGEFELTVLRAVVTAGDNVF